MGSFRRVEGDQAGPDALGILIPPGKRTFLVLRPRALPWDLVLCKSAEDLGFVQMAHDEASAAAQGVFRALRDQVAGSIVPVPLDDGGQLRVHLGTFVFVACLRLAGQPYAPLVGPDHEEAAALLSEVLFPAATACDQELYFNVRFFER